MITHTVNRREDGGNAIPGENREELGGRDGSWRRLETCQKSQEADDVRSRMALAERGHIETTITL